MKICGVVVWYNPDKVSNIKSYLNHLDKLYIVDNSNNNNFELTKNLGEITYIPLLCNKGIAYALNVGVKKALDEKYDFILTMDQDSEYEEGMFFKYINFVKNDKEEDIGIYSSIPLIGKRKEYSNEEYQYAEVAMTSGSLINLNIIKKVGLFNEDFFIDEVDTEFSFRVRDNGFKIKVVNNTFFKHSIGNTKRYKFGGKVTHHNYIRRYYITRNKLYMIKIYGERVRKKYTREIFKDLRKIVFYEKDKFLKLKMCWLAYRDFKNGVKGPLAKKYIVK